jgi:CRP-like cAMP-binding protein
MVFTKDPIGRNLLIAALPAAERDRLATDLRVVPLQLGNILYEQDQEVEDIYFPTAGAVSLLIALEDGRTLEPALIGREGVLGFPLGLGDNRSRWRSEVQVPGEALVISRAALSGHLRQAGNLAPLLTHYAGLLVTFAAQSAVCAQFHTLAQRTARWLLIMHDHMPNDEYPITQEHLAHMLGANRPSQTVTLGALAKRGVLELNRGMIRLLDRDALLAETCECYARVRREYDELVEIAQRGDVSGSMYRGTPSL